jgi:hypothetical protein
VLVAGSLVVVAAAAFVLLRGQTQPMPAAPDALPAVAIRPPIEADAKAAAVDAAVEVEVVRVEKHHSNPNPKAETLPSAVIADLDDARKALDAGDPREAARRAQHSLVTKPSARAYELLAEAACVTNDIGTVRSWLPHVAPADRKKVAAVCKKHGLDLGP